MAAKVKITGDTKDAQQKVQRLRKEVERLDREAKKPKKITVTGKNGMTGGKGVAGAVDGGLSMMKVAGGNLISMLIHGMKQYIPAVARLSGGVLGKALGLEELEKTITRITPKMRNLVSAIEVFGNPGEEVLNRADKLDALDDERRSHNSQSLAEEFAYSRAFSNIAGVNGTQIVDRIQSVLDMATSGNVSEMDKAWKQLQGFGITYDDIEKGSTWQVLSKMLLAYRTAGADGQNELEPSFQQIVGKRQMAAIRKIGDGTEMVEQAATLIKDFNDTITNQAAILEEAGKSELVRSQAEIQGMAIPKDGEHYIMDEANNLVSQQKLNTGMLGDVGEAGEALAGVWDEIKNDVQPLIDEVKDKILGMFLPDFGLSGGGNYENANINVANADMEVDNANPLAVNPPTEIYNDGAITLTPYEQVHDGNPLQELQPTLSALEPVGTPSTSTLPQTENYSPQGISPKGLIDGSFDNIEYAINELTRSLKENTNSNNMATNAIQNMNISVGANSGAVFQ